MSTRNRCCVAAKITNSYRSEASRARSHRRSRCSAVFSSVISPEISRPSSAARNAARRADPMATPTIRRLAGCRNGALATRSFRFPASRRPCESNAQPVISPTAPARRSVLLAGDETVPEQHRILAERTDADESHVGLVDEFKHAAHRRQAHEEVALLDRARD